MTPPTYRWPDSPRPPVLHISGELDISTVVAVSAQLRDHATAHKGSVVVIDLAEVSFMDSSGLDPLSQAYDALAAVDRLLLLQSLAPAVRRFFQVVNTCRPMPLVQQTLRDGPHKPDTMPSRSADLQSLRVLVNELRDAVNGSAEVEQAKGLLMGVHGCDAEQAGMLLALIARRRNVTVHEVAAERALVLAGARTRTPEVLDSAAGALPHAGP